MSNGLRDRIAKAVLDKILVMFTENDLVESASAYIADAILAIPGIAVVELPESAAAVRCWPVLVGGEPESLYLTQGEIVVSGSVRLYAEEARVIAAALLAAADYAERAP